MSTEDKPNCDQRKWATLGWEDAETALFCVLHGRARLRELGDRIDDEGVDDLAVAARMLWDALPTNARTGWFGDDSIGLATRRELAHVFRCRLNERLEMVEVACREPIGAGDPVVDELDGTMHWACALEDAEVVFDDGAEANWEPS